MLFVSLFIWVALTAPDADLVPQLKGFYDYSNEFKMYSGYLTLQAEPQISAHYIFITSKNDPVNDDVVLWLNGGPGCSSLLGKVLIIKVFCKSMDHIFSIRELKVFLHQRIHFHGITMPICYFWKVLLELDSRSTKIQPINILMLELLKIILHPSNNGLLSSLNSQRINSGYQESRIAECISHN